MPPSLSPSILRLLSRNPALEGAFVPPLARPRLAFSLCPDGLLRGGLTHLDGPASTEALLRFLSEQAGLQAAWVEARLTAYAPGFVQRGVNLACLLFVEAEEQFPWALTDLVRSRVFGAVAVASPLPDAMALRRLQLAAERAACAVLLVAPLPESAWPVRARLWCGLEAGKLTVEEVGPPDAGDGAESGGLP